MGVPLCVCQICTCGRHRCPHNHVSTMKGKESVRPDCLLTEYKFAFRGGPFQPPPKSIHPKQHAPTGRKKMDMATTYMRNYIAHKFQPHPPPAKREYKRPTSSGVVLMTTYTKEFAKKDGDRARPIKPKSDYQQHSCWKPTEGCKTVHQMTYVEFDEASRKNCRPSPVRKKENLVRSPEKFDATSTVQADFIKHSDAERPQPIIREDNTEREKGLFDGTTMYRLEFTQKQSEALAVRPTCQYKPNPAEFNGITTVMADFKPHKNARREPSFKPPPAYVKSSAPFDGRTIKSIVHCAWPVVKPEKPPWAKRPKFVPPKVTFAKTSSYKEDYPGFSDHERVSLIRPHSEDPSNFTDGSSKLTFHGVSTYTDNFRTYPGARKPPSFKTVSVYESPKEKFEPQSTMKSQYKGEYTPRSDICRPRIRSPEERKPMSFETTYKVKYTGEQNQPCPVRDRTKPTGMTHTFDVNGHQFYIPEKGECKQCVEQTQDPRCVTFEQTEQAK